MLSRPTLVVAVLVATLASCSAAEPAGAPDLTVPPPSLAADAAADAAADDAADGADTGGPSGDVGTPDSIELEVETADHSAEFSMAADERDEPFGRFASCSGWRSDVSSFSLAVADAGGPIMSFGLLTTDPVTGPGVHDADVRVEVAGGGALTGTGTVSLDADLRAGSFEAFEPDGDRISGRFACSSARPAPTPLDADEVVEVFALLRRPGMERLLAMAADATTVDAACVGGADAGPTVVRVDGDASVGSMSTFELTDGATPTLRIRAGAASFEFDDVDLQLDPDGMAGAFSARAADGLEVDGAFRCA